MTLAELVAQLVLVAAGFSGLEPLPAERLPPLEALEPAARAAQACPMQPRQCQGIVAYFDTDRGRILLSSRLDLDDAGDNSFVVLNWSMCWNGTTMAGEPCRAAKPVCVLSGARIGCRTHT
ncbi:MAG: hypothetical protein IPJ99_00250 [Betaproteobacteria bacterium]|nr:hypothetical protein [Betaproteobacteria bacterium]